MDNHLSILYNPRKCALPNAWKLIRIGDCAKLIAGGTPSTYIYEYWTEGDIPWMRSGDVHKKRIYSIDGKITKQGLNNSNATLLPINSILVALAGQGKTRGTVAINKIELCTNQSVAAIIPNREIDYEFLYYNLDARYEIFRRLSTGEGGRGGLNLQIIKNIWCSLPPLPEQRKIAEILSTWDEAIEKTERLIAALEARKKGLMQRLLTGQVRFPGFDKEWISIRLDERIEQFIVPMRDKPKVFRGRIPWCRIEDFNGIYLKRSKSGQCVDEQTIKEMNLRVYPVGTVLCSCSADLGRCAITAAPLVTNQTFIGLVPQNDLNRLFLYYYLSFNYHQLQRLSSGTTIAYLSREQFEKYKIRIPQTIEEQGKIAEILYVCDQEIELTNKYLNQLTIQKQGLMQNLLTGKIRVLNDN